MIKIVTLLWDPNDESFDFSKMYDESWVEKLYRGVERNISTPFEFVVITDRYREFSEPITQVLFKDPENIGYHSCIEAFQWDGPAIIMGLDTVITGDLTLLVEWCMNERNPMALPMDPYNPNQACNGVTLLPPGNQDIYLTHTNENDMVWLRKFSHVYIDDVLPHRVKSYKGHVKTRGLGKQSIVYFHGAEKPHELSEDWIEQHWR